uniref:Uncharacterized protein n=1 Tax=Anguilla anguilla TaxID=7936 RepID=A0A0E9XLU0_ANGAN
MIGFVSSTSLASAFPDFFAVPLFALFDSSSILVSSTFVVLPLALLGRESRLTDSLVESLSPVTSSVSFCVNFLFVPLFARGTSSFTGFGFRFNSLRSAFSCGLSLFRVRF